MHATFQTWGFLCLLPTFTFSVLCRRKSSAAWTMASFWVKAENDWRTELAAPVTVSEIFSAIGLAGEVGSDIMKWVCLFARVVKA